MENQTKAPKAANKRYFVVSDIHSHYTPLMEALDEAGYDAKNRNHVLIVCGDVFDRGDETLEVLRFLKSLPKTRRVFIRGNHELLLKECYEDGYFSDDDVSNGTEKTLCHLSGVDSWRRFEWFHKIAVMSYEEWDAGYREIMKEHDEKPFKSKRAKNVIDWIFSDEWVNYYELGKYVFVHSWVPTKIWCDDKFKMHEKVLKDWRTAPQIEWYKAMWGNPCDHYLAKSLPEDKTIVCGHWDVMTFHTRLGHDRDGYKNRDIYYSDRLIALDACTAMEPHICNVLVISGDKCYDRHGNVLTDRKEVI